MCALACGGHGADGGDSVAEVSGSGASVDGPREVLPVLPEGCQSSAACVEPTPPVSMPAGEHACSVVSCPESEAACCSAAEASANGNESQAYSSQLHMLEFVESSEGLVRADFMFDAPYQQGWVTFDLGAELDLSRVEFVGRHNGVSDRFISVTTNERGSGGCSLALDLDPLPTPDGSDGPNWFEGSVKFSKDSFCYDGGHPGRASKLAFAIFSTESGPASLIISSITLIAE